MISTRPFLQMFFCKAVGIRNYYWSPGQPALEPTTQDAERVGTIMALTGVVAGTAALQYTTGIPGELFKQLFAEISNG